MRAIECPSQRHALRLFAPMDSSLEAAAAPENLTLREAYARWLLPTLIEERRSRGTLSAYATALRHWERLSGDPPLAQIDAETLRAFVAQAGARHAPATVAKTWRHLRAILRRCASPTDRNPAGLGLVERVPGVRLPRVRRQPPRIASLEEVGALYDGCRVATWPRAGGCPVLYWRAAIVCLYTYGPRAWDLFCADATDPCVSGWRWCGIAADTIRYTQAKTGDEVCVPLTRCAAGHLAALRSELSPCDRAAVFPATLCRGDLYDQWRAIKSAAGVAALDLHDLRRTCQTEWDWLQMGLGDFVLGHTPSDVGSQYYRSFARKAAEACERLPVPPQFCRGLESLADRQLRLF